MCYYIYGLFSKPVALESVNQVAKSSGLAFEEITIPFVGAFQSAKEVFYLKSCKICDCGTSLGYLNKEFKTQDETLSKQIEKLRRKGWSATKIDRWLESKQSFFEKNKRVESAYEQFGLQHTNEVDSYIDFITTYLSSSNAPHTGLLLHWNSRHNSLEEIAGRLRIAMPIGELTAETLLLMQPNVLYQFDR